MNDSISVLVAGLSSPVREHRAHCVERLVQAGAPAVAPLCDALRTGGLLTRCAAAEALGQLGDRTATPILVRRLNDLDSEVRERAAVALGLIGDPEAVPALCVAAKRLGDPFVAPLAIEALGRLGDVRALPVLAEMLHSVETDLDLRMAAAAALGRVGHPGAVGPLTRALDGAHPGVFVEACRALGRLKCVDGAPALCKAAARAAREGPAARQAVSDALVEIGSGSLPSVVEWLYDHPSAPALAGAIRGFGPVALPALSEVLARGIIVSRLRALELLEEAGSQDPAAWEIAARALKDPNSGVRVRALLALMRSAELLRAGPAAPGGPALHGPARGCGAPLQSGASARVAAPGG